MKTHLKIRNHQKQKNLSGKQNEVHRHMLENDLSESRRGDADTDCLSYPVSPLCDSVSQSILQAAPETLKLIHGGGDSENTTCISCGAQNLKVILYLLLRSAPVAKLQGSKRLRYLDRRAGESHTAVLWKCSQFPS